MDDITLARAAALGDQEAFNELVRRYRPYVYTIAYNITLNVDDALDITQNVMVVLVRKIGGFKAEGSFRRWLATISNHEAIDYAQSRRREIAMDPEDIGMKVDAASYKSNGASTREKAIAGLERDERREKVSEAIAQLSPQQRLIFSLSFFEELRPKEISARLGLPHKQVGVQIHRSIRKLQSLMKERA